MNADSKEAAFQADIIDHMIAGGWKLGDPAKYDRKLALYTEDCLEYVKTTQPKTWEKYEKLYPSNPEQAFIDKLASQLSKRIRRRATNHSALSARWALCDTNCATSRRRSKCASSNPSTI